MEEVSTRDISCPVLQDFDWKLKLVLGSATYAAINSPLLTVDLHTSTSTDSGSGPRVVSLEMDREEARKLLKALEKAQEHVLELTKAAGAKS